MSADDSLDAPRRTLRDRSAVLLFAALMLIAPSGLATADDALAEAPGDARPDRPNVVVFLVDDFGYECIGANGSTSYETPHVDALAAGGMRFEHCYSQPLCTPTRVQLMTGLYNVRNYTRFGHLDPASTTFAQLFRDAGYATCIVGKWQLGRDVDLPRRFGFDEHCLWQLSRRPPRYANPGLEINGKEVDYSGGEYGPDLVNQYAIDFISRHRERPFLLYYPMILTHSPFQPTPDSPNWDPQATGERRNNRPQHFADMVTYCDKMVGRIVAALDREGLRERTLILFTGDNGTGRGITSRMGERVVPGGKGSSRYNGIHVPLVASWPGVIPPGRVSRDLVDTTDFLPTICEAAGVSVPESVSLDGRSFLAQLRGEPGQPRDWIYCWYARNGGATAQHEFAMNQWYKLYRDGRFFDLRHDLDEEHSLDTATLTGEAATAHQTLRAALRQYENARPAEVGAAAEASP